MSEDSVDPSKIPTVPGIYISKGEGWLAEAWTSVPNKLIRNTKIEWDAKGAFAWLASHQEMKFRVTAQMIADAGPRGRNHAYAMIRELEKWGWVTRHRLRNPETGRTDIQVYTLHPNPVAEEARTFKPSKAKAAEPTEFITERMGTDSPTDRKSTSESTPERSVTDHPVSPRPETDRPGALTRARSLDLLEDHLLTEEEDEGARAAAAASLGPFDNQPNMDPFTADISAARRKSARKKRGPSAISETARSHRAERIVVAYEDGLPRKLPSAERLTLAHQIDECLGLGWTESDIADVGLPHWNATGKGAALFARIASEAVARRPASKPSTTGERFKQHVEDHHQLFGQDGFFRDDLDRLLVESEVVDIRQLEA